MSKDIISGGEALMRSLEYHGVKTIFGYPGGSIMPVFDALYDHRETLNHILAVSYTHLTLPTNSLV